MGSNKIKEFKEKVVIWLKKKAKEAGADGLIFGMSGGIDSSIIAVISKNAFPDNHLGVFMNIESSEDDFKDAKLVADKFNITFSSIDLTNLYKDFRSLLASRFGNSHQKANANLKARLRMCTLYYIANKSNYLVVGTGNRSEALVGYFTKYGDGGVDILPIASVYKTHLKQIAQYLKIPEKIINKSPSAGLWSGQKDEEELGISYKVLDLALQNIFDKKNNKVRKNIVEKVKDMHKKACHKLKIPDIFNFKF